MTWDAPASRKVCAFSGLIPAAHLKTTGEGVQRFKGLTGYFQGQGQ